MYHLNVVKTSQIKINHSNYPDGPPSQHSTKGLAQATKGQIAMPHQQAHLDIAASWLKLRLQTCLNCTVNAGGAVPFYPSALGRNQAGPPSIRPILLCLDRSSMGSPGKM